MNKEHNKKSYLAPFKEIFTDFIYKSTWFIGFISIQRYSYNSKISIIFLQLKTSSLLTQHTGLEWMYPGNSHLGKQTNLSANGMLGPNQTVLTFS